MNADHSWLFIAVTFDSTDTGRTTFYKGTQTVAPAAVGTVGLLGTTITNNTSAFRVGKSGADLATDTTPPAWFDDVRVYGSVLSLAELNAVRLENVPEPSSATLAAREHYLQVTDDHFTRHKSGAESSGVHSRIRWYMTTY